MAIREIEAKSILRKHKKIDSWFLSRYGMNLYRGCSHNCVYCDGRAEGYYVEGEFGKDVSVKINAADILSRELDPKRKRVPLTRGFVIVGGGVGDSYQPIEKDYQLTRKVLELLDEYDFPVHMLTKSTLIERDLDILKKINKKNRSVVSFSFSSVDDKVGVIFEPGVPLPSRRLETISKFKNEGFSCGMFLLPVIPFITDTRELLEESVSRAKNAGVDFIIFGGMTLKDGKQKDYFLNALSENYPHLGVEYANIYKGDKWGGATEEYYQSISQVFKIIAKNYNMPVRMPFNLFKGVVKGNDLVVVLLEHIDYLLKMEGRTSSFGYAAYLISQVKEPLSEFSDLGKIKGVGEITAGVIREILKTGTSSYYKKLLN